MQDRKEIEEALIRVEEKIQEIRSRLPAHSTKTSMMMALLDLEDEAHLLRQRLNRY